MSEFLKLYENMNCTIHVAETKDSLLDSISSFNSTSAEYKVTDQTLLASI